MNMFVPVDVRHLISITIIVIPGTAIKTISSEGQSKTTDDERDDSNLLD